MSVNIKISLDGKVKTISDDNNPRIYSTEYKCTKCGMWINSEDNDLHWVDSQTGAETDGEGDPYCGDCFPLNEDAGSNKFGGDTGVDADFEV